MRALKAGALYFAIVFATGWIFGPIRVLWIVPHLGETAGVLLEAPLMLVVMVVAARWTVRRLALPTSHKTRIAVGLTALGLLLVAEVLGARWLRGVSIADVLAGFRSVSGAITLLLFVIFAAVPILVGRR
jgi:hypothetical protein